MAVACGVMPFFLAESRSVYFDLMYMCVSVWGCDSVEVLLLLTSAVGLILANSKNFRLYVCGFCLAQIRYVTS